MRTSAALRLGVYALPFGYGPASKAIAVAQALHARGVATDWIFISSGIGLDLMARSAVPATVVDARTLDVDEELARQLTTRLDGMIVVMHRPWANRLAPHLPVFCVDSLGFMWRPDAFEKFPGIQRVERYYAQDVFGASEALRATGLRQLTPVPPIVDLRRGSYDMGSTKTVFHLGGLLNPFPDDLTTAYVAGIAAIARRLDASALVLTSSAATQRFAGELAGLRAESLSHGQAISAFCHAGLVHTTPGLTCLLELAHLRVAAIPLPPENYSQLLNLRQMVTRFGASLPRVWHLLTQSYASIDGNLEERQGVEQVAELNARRLSASWFRHQYVAAASVVSPQDGFLPAALRADVNGADVIAADIGQYFAARGTRR